MSFGAPLRDSFIKIGIQICFLKDRVNNVDRVVSSVLSVRHAAALGLHQPGILDSLLTQAELEHFDSADQVLVDVLLCLELALKLGDLGAHLAFLEEPLCLFGEVCALHLFQRADDLVEVDLLATACIVVAPHNERAAVVIVAVIV